MKTPIIALLTLALLPACQPIDSNDSADKHLATPGPSLVDTLREAPPTEGDHPSAPRLEAEAIPLVPAPQKAMPLADGAATAGMVLAREATSTIQGYAPPTPWPAPDGETYHAAGASQLLSVGSAPLSTFSIDVDTGSYSNARRMIQHGKLPPAEAVRTEEFINYFRYAYPEPRGRHPFSVTTELAVAPWNPQHRLLRIGLKGKSLPANQRPDTNLVFLVDVSGSMQAPDKLPLLQASLKMLSRQLTARDRVSIVVYAGASGVVLEPTCGNDTAAIDAALSRLQAGGSTHGSAGIQLAYAMAREGFIDGGINRVILATDGDFNVGITQHDDLIHLIEKKRTEGIALTTLGFGSGNYNDAMLEQLADHGNGNHAYIDTINEARKVLVEQIGSTLVTIAHDVKIQVEFNPQTVSQYRLIGYQNRALANEDFNNDHVDAGEIGAGHTVTALYEIVPAGSDAAQYRYTGNRTAHQVTGAQTEELAHVKLRYKQPNENTGVALDQVVMAKADGNTPGSADMQFATAVAIWAEQLRGQAYVEGISLAELLALAHGGRGADPNGYRAEFIRLAESASQFGG